MSFLLLLLFVSLCWTQEAIKLDLYLAEKERLTPPFAHPLGRLVQ
jgi:hypothetical protein